MTAYKVMQEVFPDISATELFPGMSEDIGYLDILEDQGHAVIEYVDAVAQYRLIRPDSTSE